ncbi:MAG: hypothetical protein GWN81_14715, partial [Phycisphaerae bacterium]|nr:hypothetical protein [Phycisphaerae bacterium]NIW99958.1 hypothetical protein [Phycisphaerae bacterium]
MIIYVTGPVFSADFVYPYVNLALQIDTFSPHREKGYIETDFDANFNTDFLFIAFELEQVERFIRELKRGNRLQIKIMPDDKTLTAAITLAGS